MKARTMVAIALALAGCSKAKDKAETKGSGSGSSSGSGSDIVAAIDAAPAPLVVKLPDSLPTSSHAIALEPGVKLFVTLDAKGALAIGAVPADRKAAWPAPRAIADLRMLEGARDLLMAGVLTGEDPDALGKRIAELPPPSTSTPAPAPPPIPDPKVEPLDDQASLLNEGKMGQRSPLERARDVHHGEVAWSDEAYAGLGNDPTPVPETTRTTTTGVPYDGADDDHLRIAVLADAAADARALIPVLDRTGECALGVRDAGGGVARSVVRFGFRVSDAPWREPSELLVDVLPGGVTVRSGPGPTHGAAAWTGDQIDAVALGTAIEDSHEGRPDVVITIGEGVSVQRFVSVVDALVDAGAKELIVRNWTRPELHGPVITMEWAQVVDGTLPVTAIRPAMVALGAAIKQCYLEALQTDPALAGTASAAVVLGDGAAVKDVVVESKLPIGDCTKTALRAISLTTPDGKGGAFSVQLRYRMVP